MVSLSRNLFMFFQCFSRFFSLDFVVDEVHFRRLRKWSLEDYIVFILTQKSCTNQIDVNGYLRLSNRKIGSITSQAVGKQRQYILPDVFTCISDEFVDHIYQDFPCLFNTRGYLVVACDGSQIDLPNHPQVRQEFNLFKRLWKDSLTRGRISCLLDVKSQFIMTSIIEDITVSEVALAMRHLDALNERYDMEKVITIYDRGYASMELVTKSLMMDTKFLIRLPKNVLKYERNKMKTNDEIVPIKMNAKRYKEFNHPELKEYAEKAVKYNLRIAIVDIGNENEKEILLTNLHHEEFSTEDLKELYSQRWRVETGYNDLKNKIQIEEFAGRRKTIIEQDFYAKIFIYNLAIAIKITGNKQIKRKTRNNKQKINYLSNLAIIIGNIYQNLYYLITQPRKQKEEEINNLIKEAAKRITQKKEENQNTERKTPDASNKHPGNIKRTH